MSWRRTAAALAGVLLVSCAGARPRAYAQKAGPDSVTAGCATNPVNCSALTGVVPESGSAAQAMAATGMLATVVLTEVLDQATQAKVDKVVKECADWARADVLVRLFNGKSPTSDECKELVTLPNREVPRYLFFGEEMHDAAFACVKDKLGKLIPGRFSIRPRYRFDERTQKTTWMSPDEEDQIRRDGRYIDLKGTIEPDLVIHDGNARHVQAVYDFKFPCENTDDQPRWRAGPKPDGSEDQDLLYERRLGKRPAMVVPILGIFR
jgi:hypothetical protein